MDSKGLQPPSARRVSILLVLLAAVMGFIGFAAQDPMWPSASPTTFVMGALDIGYQTVQLFILDGPESTLSNQQSWQNWLLSCARFLAPVSLAGYLVTLSERLWRPLMERWRVSRLRNHTVILGDDKEAAALARDLLNRSKPFVILASSPLVAEQLRGDLGRRSLIRTANGGSGVDWERLRTDWAEQIFLMRDDETNLKLARQLAKNGLGARGEKYQQVLIRLADAALKRELVSRQNLFAAVGKRRFEPFNTQELVARRFFHQRNIFLYARRAGHDALHWVILGWDEQIAALCEQLVKVAPYHGMRPPLLTIYAPNTSEARFWLERRFEAVQAYVRWHVFAWPDHGTLPELASLTFDDAEAPPVSGYVIANNDAHGAQLGLALDGQMLRQRLDAAPIHILVRQSLPELISSLSLQNQHEPMSVEIDLSIVSPERDRAAMALHDAYRGYSGKGPPWDDLDENFRAANRRAADHAKTKLEALGIAGPLLDPKRDIAALKQAVADDLEDLAIAEHHSWSVDRLLNGWRYGQTRNDSLRLHPNLIPFEDLTEYERNLDRWQVEQLPVIAAAQPA